MTDNPLPKLPPEAWTPEIRARMTEYLQQSMGNPQRALHLAVVELEARTRTASPEEVTAALEAWFETTLKGTSPDLRKSVLESHRDRMHAALDAAERVRNG